MTKLQASYGYDFMDSKNTQMQDQGFFSLPQILTTERENKQYSKRHSKEKGVDKQESVSGSVPYKINK